MTLISYLLSPPLNQDSDTILDEHDIPQDSDTILNEHDFLQLYDIIYFEHKPSWFCFRLPKKRSTNGESII